MRQTRYLSPKRGWERERRAAQSGSLEPRTLALKSYARNTGIHATGDMNDGGEDLRRLVLSGEEGPTEGTLERLLESRSFGDVWSELRDVHRELDRQWRDGSLPPECAVEMRSRLSTLALQLVRLAVDREVRAYREFLRDVSHDIRSPLHSIIFLTEALHSSRSGERPEAEQRQLGTIYAAATSLLNLVNDLLDFARIAEGEVDEVSEYAFSLSSVLSDVEQLLEPLADHFGTELSVHSLDSERFVGDPQLLSRVLTNLVSNGIEATGKGGRVVVRLARHDDGLAGTVWDDGGDADLEKLQALLDVSTDGGPMTRVRRKLDGSSHGLGLMICSRLIQRVDGWIRVETAESAGGKSGGGPATGTRFRFWLPFTPEQADP